MKISSRKNRGFTLTELLVVIGVVFVLFVLLGFVLPDTNRRIRLGRLIQATNNARQIHISTMAMAVDGEANQNTSLGWPGDLKANGKIQNIQDFVAVLVKSDYLKPRDLSAFAAPGVKGYRPKDSSGTYAPPFEEKNSAFKVYLVRKDDPGNEVFLATKNYTYNAPLDPKTKPFGEDGFVVCRKGGDVSMYRKQQVQNLQMIGTLPGGGTVEGPENCLNP